MSLTSDTHGALAAAVDAPDRDLERRALAPLEAAAASDGSRERVKAQLDADIEAHKRAVLLVNRRARRGRQFYREAKRLLEASGFELDARHSALTTSRLSKLVAEAIAEGHRLIIVGGGDGTLSHLLPHFVHREVVLGILPLGTANSFARTLGIPLDLPSAIDVIVSGKVVDVDVGRIGDAYFCTSAAVGLAARIARHTPPGLKRWLGRWAYPLVALTQLSRFGHFRCTVTANGRQVAVDALEVRIANGAHQGGVAVNPGASAESRDLVAHITVGRSLRKLLHVWLRLSAGAAPDVGDMKTIRSSHFAIDATPRQYVSVDGEALTRTPFEVSVAQQALLVMVPSDQHHLR